MVFERIADFVINNYKKLLVIWIVIFIMTGYLATLSGDVVVYEDTEMAPPDIESAEADDIISKEFLDMPNSTAVLVIQQDDIRSPAMVQYMLDLEEDILAEVTEDCEGTERIRCFESMTTIFSVYRQLIKAMGSSLGAAMYDLETNVSGVAFMVHGLPYIYISVWDGVATGINGSAIMVYGLPASYVTAVDGTDQASFLLYGLPSMFAQAWDGVNGSATLIHGLPSMFAEAWDGVDGSAMMMYGIPSMFAEAWDGVNGSAMMMYGIPSMFAEAWYGTNTTAFGLYGIPYMFEEAWQGNRQLADLIYGGPAAYMQTWANLAPFYPNTTQLNLETYNQSWAVINASITDEQERQYVQGYHWAFHLAWDDTFNASSPAYLDPATTPLPQRAQASVDDSAPEYFTFTDPVDQQQLAMWSVWSNFTVTDFQNITLHNQYAANATWTMLEGMTAGMDIPEEQLTMFRSYYDAFTTAWNASFLNSSLDTYTPEERAAYAIGQVAPGFIEQAAGGDETIKAMFEGVLATFNMTTWHNETLMNIHTNQTFNSMMQAMAGDLGLPPEMEQQLWMYYDMWYSGWNASFTNSSLAGADPTARAWHAVNSTAPAFIDQTAAMDERARPMLEAVLASFDMTTWSNTTLVNTVTNETFYGTMQAMAGDLGLPQELVDQLWAYYDGLFQAWTATFDNASFHPADSIGRAAAAVASFAPGFVDSVAAENETAGSMLGGVLSTFDMTNWMNSSIVNSFTRDFFLMSIGDMVTGIDPGMLQDMYDYFDLFYGEWAGSFDDPVTVNLSSRARAEGATTIAGAVYISQTAEGDPVTEAFLQGILMSFNGTTWDDIDAINAYAGGYFRSTLGPMAAEMGVSDEMVQQLERYFDLVYIQWNASFKLPPLREYPPLKRAEYAAQAAAPAFIDEVAQGNETISSSMLGVLEGLDIDTWNDTTAIEDHAFDVMVEGLETMGAEMGLDDKALASARAYLDAFRSSWNATRDGRNSTLEERTAWAVADAVPAYAATLPKEEAAFMLATLQGLDMSTWNDTRAQETLANELAADMFWSLLDDLMTNMTGGGAPDPAMTEQLEGYFDAFYARWNATFDPLSPHHMARDTDPLVRGKAVVDAVAPVHFDFEVVDDDTSEFMDAVYRYFSFDNWSSIDGYHDFTIDYMYLMMTDDTMRAMTFERSFFEDIYDLGVDPTEEEIDAFAESVLRGGTLDTYPIRLSESIVSQFINEKNDTMIISIGFNKGTGAKYGKIIDKDLEEIGKISRRVKRDHDFSDMKVYVSGSAPLSIQLEESVDNDISRIDIVTAIVVLILISIFFRSFVTPTIPLASIGAAIVATFGLIFIVGSYLLQIHYTVITLTFTALMGAGIDYCIFIIARYKEERKAGKDKVEAIRTSVTWAGESITTSGVAVMIGFGGLSILAFAMVRGMGVILPLGIGIAILVSLTFLPSLMMLVGDGIFWVPKSLRRKGTGEDDVVGKGGKRGKREKRAKAKRKKVSRRKDLTLGATADGEEQDREKVFYFSNAVDFATKHAKAIILVALLISMPTTYLVMTLETSFDFFTGMPETEAKQGLEAMAEGFGKSKGMETKVVIEAPGPIYQDGVYDTTILDSVDNLTDRLERMDEVRRVDPSTYQEGERIDRVDCWSSFGDAWKDTCLQTSLGRSNSTVIITVTLKKEPFHMESLDAIDEIRDIAKGARGADPVLKECNIVVGGATASMKDIEALMAKDMDSMRIIVIVLIFVLLLVVLGSVLIPITAIISIGLSISWTLAATMLVFTYIKGQPILWLMPLILFVVLMGLGMDYNIFIITRMREEVLKGYSDRVAIRRAVERTGGIITACGAIMAGAFGSMMLSQMGILQQFGFALFFAIMLDAFVVRIYLMPAIIVLLQKWNWWAPGRLQRVKRDADGKVTTWGKGRREDKEESEFDEDEAPPPPRKMKKAVKAGRTKGKKRRRKRR